MSTFRVNKNVNYTVMSNHHLQDKRLSLKAKGLLSYMLSLPDDWDYSLKGLTTGCRDGIDSVRSAVHELEDGGYLCRSKVRDARGRIIDYNYEVFELPQKERIEKRPAPVPNSPSSENPMSGFPTLENPTQQNTNKQNTKRQSTNLSGQTDESADFDQMETQVREEFRERLEIDTLAQRYDPDKLEELLGISVGETTPDGLFSIVIARCLGACGLAPVIMIDDVVYQKCEPSKMQEILDQYQD